MTLRAVVYDLFGTLVPKWSSELARAALRRISSVLGVDHEEFTRAWQQTDVCREVGRVSVEHGFEVAAQSCSVTDRQRVDEAIAIWLALVRDRLTPRESVAGVLAACRERGLRVGLLSDCNDDVPRVFRTLSIAAQFDVLGFSCELGAMKPEPRVYLEVCRRLGVEPRECVYVGDGGSDELRGAREVGMTPVFLRHAAEIELEGLPNGACEWSGAVIESLDELWRELGLSDPSLAS
ncbi:MAG: HAD-IA family hydrolase [Polyangiaceae bacterium]